MEILQKGHAKTCTTAGSIPAELSSRSCRIFHGKVPSGQSRYRIAIMEVAASVARTPATCLEVWSGDHRQTLSAISNTFNSLSKVLFIFPSWYLFAIAPGGLKKSKEAKAFWKKLTKRPLALRCQTQRNMEIRNAVYSGEKSTKRSEQKGRRRRQPAA